MIVDLERVQREPRSRELHGIVMAGWKVYPELFKDQDSSSHWTWALSGKWEQKRQKRGKKYNVLDRAARQESRSLRERRRRSRKLVRTCTFKSSESSNCHNSFLPWC